MSRLLHKTLVSTASVLLCAIVSAQTVQQWLQGQRTQNSVPTASTQAREAIEPRDKKPKVPNTKSSRVRKPTAEKSEINHATSRVGSQTKDSTILSTDASTDSSSSQKLRLVALIHHTEASVARTTQAIVMRGKISWILYVGQLLPTKPSLTASTSAVPTKIQAINDDHVILQQGAQTIPWNIGTVYEE